MWQEQPNGACELQASGEVVRSLKFYSSNMGVGAVRFGWKGDAGHLVVRWGFVDVSLSAGMGLEFWGGRDSYTTSCCCRLWQVFEVYTSFL